MLIFCKYKYEYEYEYEKNDSIKKYSLLCSGDPHYTEAKIF